MCGKKESLTNEIEDEPRGPHREEGNKSKDLDYDRRGMDHFKNASSHNRRASSSTIPDTSERSSRRSYIFTTSGKGEGKGGVDRGVALDNVE
jgi:hypothetical protein